MPKIPNMLVALLIAMAPGVALWIGQSFPPDIYWWSAAAVVLVDGALRYLQQYSRDNMAAMDPADRPSFGAKLGNVIAGKH